LVCGYVRFPGEPEELTTPPGFRRDGHFWLASVLWIIIVIRVFIDNTLGNPDELPDILWVRRPDMVRVHHGRFGRRRRVAPDPAPPDGSIERSPGYDMRLADRRRLQLSSKRPVEVVEQLRLEPIQRHAAQRGLQLPLDDRTVAGDRRR